MASKHPSLLSDLGTSLFSQAVVVAGNITTLRLAAQCMDVAEVGEFALVRRVVAFVAPLLMLGLGVGLPRFLGRSATEPGRHTALALAGWILVLPTTLAAAFLLTLRPQAAATLFFGTSTAADLARPLALLLVGNQMFLLVFATWRGELRIRAANLLQSALIGLLPIAVVLAFGRRGASATLSGIAAGMLLATACAAAGTLHRAARGMQRGALRSALGTLGGYGIVRVPGDLAIAGLYALGPILTAHALDLRAAGSLAIGLSLVTALSAVFTPLGTVLLPRLSGQLVGPDAERVRARMPLFAGAAVHAAAFLAISGVLFGNDLLYGFLGSKFTFPPLVLALLVAGAAGNALFVILRSVLDAETATPLNAIHALVAVTLLLGVWVIAGRIPGVDPLVGICFAVAASLIALGLLTLTATLRRFRVAVHGRAILRGLGVVAITLVWAMLLHGWRAQHLALLVVQQAVLVAAWIATLRVLRLGWWMEIERTLRARRRRGLPSAPAIGAPRHVACSVPTASSGAEGPADLEPTHASHP